MQLHEFKNVAFYIIKENYIILSKHKGEAKQDMLRTFSENKNMSNYISVFLMMKK